MINISDNQISVEEAKAALRCMRLSGLSEEESLESLESFTERIRKVSTAKLIEDIIENQLTDVQKTFVKEYWYEGKTTTAIAREHNVSQASAYRTLARANDTIRRLMTPLVEYHNDLIDTRLVPLYLSGIMEICAARNSSAQSFCTQLRNFRLSYAITAQQLSKHLKITECDLLDIESGKKMPSLTTMLRYSALFSLEIIIDINNGRGDFQCKQVLLN